MSKHTRTPTFTLNQTRILPTQGSHFIQEIVFQDIFNNRHGSLCRLRSHTHQVTVKVQFTVLATKHDFLSCSWVSEVLVVYKLHDWLATRGQKLQDLWPGWTLGSLSCLVFCLAIKTQVKSYIYSMYFIIHYTCLVDCRWCMVNLSLSDSWSQEKTE